MSGFGIVDWILFLGSLLLSLSIGAYYALYRKQVTNVQLLVGSRSMSVLPITLSLMASYVNAILIIGFAGEIYQYGSIISEFVIGCLFWVPVAGFIFLPTLYPLKLTSVYEYLELRFESTAVRQFATLTFMTQILLFMGVVIYAPSIALTTFLDFPVWASILTLGGCAGIYSSLGGIRAVVWTDVLQIGIMLAGMLAIVVKGAGNVGGIRNVFEIADKHGRIEFLNFDPSPFTRHTSLSMFFGNGLFWLSAFGCHQITVQRYCSLPSLKQAFAALFLSAPLLALTIGLGCLCGIIIFANFAGCDPISLGLIKRADQIAPHFVKVFLSPTPGLVGLFMACLFSGALSTISSAINSLQAVTWQDFAIRLKYFKNMTEIQQGIITKFIGFIFTGLIIGIGFLASQLGGILNTAIIVNGSVSGPLLGVFLLGVVIPFSNKYGAFFGMLIAHILVLWVSIGALGLEKLPPLPLSIDDCPTSGFLRQNHSDFTAVNSRQKLQDLEWPRKLYSISYLLYPLMGTLLTIISGSIISIFTGGFNQERKVDLLHPLIVKFYRYERNDLKFHVDNELIDHKKESEKL